jgi:hypothetical protein
MLFYASKLSVFLNRVLRKISGLEREEITGGWRKLHNEQLHNLYSSTSIIRMIKTRRACSMCCGEEECI